MQEGAFDEAVVGIDAVEHTASQVLINDAIDPQEVIQPAVKGTTGAPTVKRVVITSDTSNAHGLVTEQPPEPGEGFPVLDESVWNTISPREVERKGKDAAGIHKYRTSKYLAERAAVIH